MRLLLLHLALLALITSTSAVTCRGHDGGGETTCEGDYCIASGYNTFTQSRSRKGCLTGKTFASYVNRTWNNVKRSIHVCDSDLCNESDTIPEFAPVKGHLTCGESKNCHACVGLSDNPVRQMCSYADFEFNSDVPRPQSCVREQTLEVAASVKCVCDTGDNCAEKLINEQTLQSYKVQCRMGFQGGQVGPTCTGDFCFVMNSVGQFDEKVFLRGCITNNETLYPGLHQVGYLRTQSREYILCDSKLCNADWTTGLKTLEGEIPANWQRHLRSQHSDIVR